MLTNFFGNASLCFKEVFTSESNMVTFNVFVLNVIWLALLIAILIRCIRLKRNMTKVGKDMKSGNYKEIPEIGEPLLRLYLKQAKRWSKCKLGEKYQSVAEYLRFSLAISYFALSEDEKFLENIQGLNHNTDVKEFWLALYYLQKEDWEEFKIHQEKISDSDELKANRTYLEAYFAFKQGNKELAREILSPIYDFLNYPILKDIARSVLE